MKKLYVFAFLCVVLILCAIGCADENSSSAASENTPTDSTQTIESLTAEEAANIYLSESDAWMYNGESQPLNGHGYCLIDLDFDGVLELITSVCDGSGRYSYNTFYTINLQTRRVTEIPQESVEIGGAGVDYYYMAGDSKLFKNKSDASLNYLFADYVHVGANEGILSYEKVYIKEGKVFEEPFFSEYWYPNQDPSLPPLKEYTVENKTATEDEYTKASESFYNEHEDMGLVWKYVLGSDFSIATDSEKKQLLLDAYRAFSYNGFSFDMSK